MRENYEQCIKSKTCFLSSEIFYSLIRAIKKGKSFFSRAFKKI